MSKRDRRVSKRDRRVSKLQANLMFAALRSKRTMCKWVPYVHFPKRGYMRRSVTPSPKAWSARHAGRTEREASGADWCRCCGPGGEARWLRAAEVNLRMAYNIPGEITVTAIAEKSSPSRGAP